MNREIKFRAWLKDAKFFAEIRQISFFEGETVVKIYDQPMSEEVWFDLEDLELLQYTGLNDKNGVEIYEGDIIASQNSDRDNWYVSHHEVVWHDAGLQAKQICSNGSHIGLSYWTRGENGYVVIGNIYENPELLEATQ